MLHIDGHTRQLGIIGWPASHSFSPKMHNFISDITGNNYVYSAWNVRPENLKQAIDGVRALGIRGINVTAPHKKAVMEYLDEISEQAKLLGSVNTVVNRNGTLCGYNTDADGFYTALASSGIELFGKRILILGAGGVVMPVLIRIIQEKPLSVTVLNRTSSKAEKLARAIKERVDYDIKTTADSLEFDVVINTTSAGMEPQENVLPIDMIDGVDSLDFINEGTAVIDMIYNPEKTRFLAEAEKRGAKTINGLGMLIYQGILAYELFTETKLPEGTADVIKKEVFCR